MTSSSSPHPRGLVANMATILLGLVLLLLAIVTHHATAAASSPTPTPFMDNSNSIPSFLRHKISQGVKSQPLMSLDSAKSSHLPSISHYIHATLQSRNHRFHKRQDEIYEAHAIISEDSIRAVMYRKNDLPADSEEETTSEVDSIPLHHKKDLYIYENGRLLHNDNCVEDPSSVAPMVHLSELVQKLNNLKNEGYVKSASPGNDASESDSAAPQTFDQHLNQECANMQIHGLVYADSHFALCSDDHELRHVVGETLWMDILEWSVDADRIEERKHEKMHAFWDKLHVLKTCPFPVSAQQQSTSPLSSFTEHAHKPWFQSSITCKLPFLRDSSLCRQQEKQHDNTEALYDCVFLHGVGEWITGNLTDTFHDYWGHVEDYTPQCKTRTFIHQETKMRGWDNEQLQEAYCEAALTGNAPGDRVIRNKLLYVHSMGNMVLAAAVESNKCQIDKETSYWYNIMGPMHGSKAAIMLQRICNQVNSGVADRLYRFIALEGGYCMPNSNFSYPAYRTLAPEYKGVAKLMEGAKQYISGSMCGDSSTGLLSRYSVLRALAFVVGYDYPNDGMVPIPSCSIPEADYKEDYENLWYRADVNHADGTCRSGDSWLWGRRKCPCSWYSVSPDSNKN